MKLLLTIVPDIPLGTLSGLIHIVEEEKLFNDKTKDMLSTNEEIFSFKGIATTITGARETALQDLGESLTDD
jgi:hypothetical protein